MPNGGRNGDHGLIGGNGGVQHQVADNQQRAGRFSNDQPRSAMNGNGKLGIRVARENDFILVEIADNGPGIPPEVKSRIFDPFFTTKGVGQGTGLGLDVVSRIIKNVHGQISVASVPGDTRFQVRIPIQAAR